MVSFHCFTVLLLMVLHFAENAAWVQRSHESRGVKKADPVGALPRTVLQKLTLEEEATIDLMAQRMAARLRNRMDSEIERLGGEIYGAIKLDQEKADAFAQARSSAEGQSERRNNKRRKSQKSVQRIFISRY